MPADHHRRDRVRTGGNPDLEPIRSTNYDAGLEWYFAENSLLAAGLFYMDLDNYVGFGTETKTLLHVQHAIPGWADVLYDLDVPVNAAGPRAGRRARVSAGDQRELRLCRELHVRGRQADLAGDRAATTAWSAPPRTRTT